MKTTLTHRAGSPPHYQGQIYDDTTGKTVAITYNDEGGALGDRLAASYDALSGMNPEAVAGVVEALRRHADRWDKYDEADNPDLGAFTRAALAALTENNNQQGDSHEG